MDFFKLSKLGLKARWTKEHITAINYITNNHEALKKERARLLGFIMGDGSVTSIKSHKKVIHYDIKFYPDDITLVRIFVSDFNKLYLKKPSIRKLKGHYRVAVSSKPAWEDLQKIGKFNSLEWEFPISLSSEDEKIEWMRAMFDCEAHVGKKMIQVQSVSWKGLNSVKRLLEEFQIKSKIYEYQRKNRNWNTNYLLTITKRENIIKYAKLVGFNHPIKLRKLRNLPVCQNG